MVASASMYSGGKKGERGFPAKERGAKKNEAQTHQNKKKDNLPV